MRIPRSALAVTAGLLVLYGIPGTVRGDPPAGTQAAAASASSSGAQVSEIKGGFFSSFSQAFKENFDREDVRGHFDAGPANNTRRYYCLLDPKTGRNQPNAITGDLVPRRDGTTGIKGAAVTPLSCADAEQKGLLVTAGYKVTGSAGPVAAPTAKAAAPAAASTPSPAAPIAAAATAAAVPMAAGANVAPAPPAPAPTAPAARAPPAAVVPSAVGTAGSAGASVDSEVLGVFERFIASQNAHDRAALSALLLDSGEFVWARAGGDSIYGRSQALDAFEREWKGVWRLDPQLKEARVTGPVSGTAVLIAPVLFTSAAPGEVPSMVPLRFGGVFIRTSAGWRIASIFMTPFRDWRAPR